MKTSDAFAWWDEEKKEFCHVYSSKFCVKMCFPDNGKKDTELGLGKIVPVTITEREENPEITDL